MKCTRSLKSLSIHRSICLIQNGRLYMVVEPVVCSIVDKFFRIHLIHLKRFYDAKSLSLIAKWTFEIIFLGGYVFGIVFFKIIK